jgi:hypothetical protein
VPLVQEQDLQREQHQLNLRDVAQVNCPRTNGSGDTNLSPLDTTSPTTFDNAYYTNLLSQLGLLHLDQELFNGGSTDSTVRNFASSAFTAAMVNMGNISPKTGSEREIRLRCTRVLNSSDKRRRRERTCIMRANDKN